MHISLKTGHQVLPKKIWLPFIRKSNSYIQIARIRGSGVRSTWYCRAKAQQVAHSLPEWYNLPQVFNSFPFFPGGVDAVETYQGIYRLLQCTVPLRAFLPVLFRTTFFFTLKTNKNLKLFFIKSPTKRRIEVI